ncbi:MAG: hypothetical protein ACOYMZ_00320 [Minisyncoccia bacterium]
MNNTIEQYARFFEKGSIRIASPVEYLFVVTATLDDITWTVYSDRGLGHLLMLLHIETFQRESRKRKRLEKEANAAYPNSLSMVHPLVLEQFLCKGYTELSMENGGWKILFVKTRPPVNSPPGIYKRMANGRTIAEAFENLLHVESVLQQ